MARMDSYPETSNITNDDIFIMQDAQGTKKVTAQTLKTVFGSSGEGGGSGYNDIYAETSLNMGRKSGTDIGDKSIAFGESVEASEKGAQAFGLRTVASGLNSHAEGATTTASGDMSHAEGQDTVSSGGMAHAEGRATKAEGDASHAEGSQTQAIAVVSHAEGGITVAEAWCSHSEGYTSRALNVGTEINDPDVTSALLSEIFNNPQKGASHAEGYETVTTGIAAHAEGVKTVAAAHASHAEGSATSARGNHSHVEGRDTRVTSTGEAAHAEGRMCLAGSEGTPWDPSNLPANESLSTGEAAHAEGIGTVAAAKGSHAEGVATFAKGPYSHAEGRSTKTEYEYSHAEGQETICSGIGAHSEGYQSVAANNYCHAEGVHCLSGGAEFNSSGGITITSGTITGCHAEGKDTIADYDYSHAEGKETVVRSIAGHVEGIGTKCGVGETINQDASNSTNERSGHAEGINSVVHGIAAHAEGYATLAGGDYSHTEGYMSSASSLDTSVPTETPPLGSTKDGTYAHAEGAKSKAFGLAAHAEGICCLSSGQGSHAEGQFCQATSNYAHAEGYRSKATRTGAHAEGYQCNAAWEYAHAEGYNTSASGTGAHAEGQNTIAFAERSHAGGYNSKARHVDGFVHGYYLDTTDVGAGQFLCGRENVIIDAPTYTTQNSSTALFIVGNGTASNNRSNAFQVMSNGAIQSIQELTTSGADYAEYIKPWADGNEFGEDRIGYFVTVKNGKLHKAQPGDYIDGVTSGNPSILGNGDIDYYYKYERDVFNRIIMEDIPEVRELVDENGEVVIDPDTGDIILEETGNIIPQGRMKIRDDYDPSQKYIPRSERKEWDCVGMMGLLPVRDDGTCMPDEFCKCGIGGIATYSDSRNFDTFKVIERITGGNGEEGVVLVLLK